MTIKKRLFISNILMFILPALISFLILGIGFLLFYVAFNDTLLEIIPAEPAPWATRREKLSTGLLLTNLIPFLFFVAVMCFTNLFLTKFISKKINKPLEMLSSGVRQISNGNLDYAIIYQENDEFKPICEDFNNMAAQLKASVEEVRKNEQSRKELIAGISHDLRSPLTSIKAFVEGLLDGVANTPESQQEYLQIIKQKADDITNMVTQLFLYSKMDMGNYPTHPEILNIGREITDFVSASHDDYKAKGLLVEVAGELADREIYADPVQLHSVFANILDNSAKYKVNETAKARIACTAEDGMIKIVFADDGPGVAEDTLAKLFDVFYRNDPSRNSPQQGSGLGLAIAAKALERMAGRIYAENICGGGLRIIVEIPEENAKENPKENPK